MRPFFLASLLSCIFALLSVQAVAPQTRLTNGLVYIQVASHPTLDEAIARAATLTPQFPDTSVFSTSSGWYAVVIGEVAAESATSIIAGLVAQSAVPDDTLSTSGKGYRTKVWPQKNAAEPSGQPLKQARDVALLLFDAETHQRFAGCLNCNRYETESICNRYGDFGSRYSDTSIWNRYGDFGSKYEDNSPWNRYGEGLIVVDPDGNFYGQFSLNRYARYGQSRSELVQALLRLYENGTELDEIRDVLCEQ